MGVLMIRLPEDRNIDRAVYHMVERERVADWESRGWSIVAADPETEPPGPPGRTRFNGLKFLPKGSTGE